MTRFSRYVVSAFARAMILVLVLLPIAAFISIAETAPMFTPGSASYEATTNIATILNKVVPQTPEQVRGPFELCLAICSSLLALWNTWQHRRILALETEKRKRRTMSRSYSALP